MSLSLQSAFVPSYSPLEAFFPRVQGWGVLPPGQAGCWPHAVSLLQRHTCVRQPAGSEPPPSSSYPAFFFAAGAHAINGRPSMAKMLFLCPFSQLSHLLKCALPLFVSLSTHFSPSTRKHPQLAGACYLNRMPFLGSQPALKMLYTHHTCYTRTLLFGAPLATLAHFIVTPSSRQWKACFEVGCLRIGIS